MNDYPYGVPPETKIATLELTERDEEGWYVLLPERNFAAKPFVDELGQQFVCTVKWGVGEQLYAVELAVFRDEIPENEQERIFRAIAQRCIATVIEDLANGVLSQPGPNKEEFKAF